MTKADLIIDYLSEHRINTLHQAVTMWNMRSEYLIWHGNPRRIQFDIDDPEMCYKLLGALFKAFHQHPEVYKTIVLNNSDLIESFLVQHITTMLKDRNEYYAQCIHAMLHHYPHIQIGLKLIQE